MDDGFRYAIPDRYREGVTTGSLVRVPLGGRRVAGFVVGIEDGPDEKLKPIAALSGGSTVFDEPLLEVMRWASRHYVAPLSVMLARCAPPNRPPRPAAPPGGALDPPTGSHPLLDLVGESVRPGPVVWLDGGEPGSWIAPLGQAMLSNGRSMLVVVPTSEEVASIRASLGGLGASLVTVDHEMDDAAVTAAWGQARHHASVLVGTPRVASWPVHHPGAMAVVEESRRAMKDRQTPTVHVREIIAHRAARASVVSVFSGPSPSLELLAASPRVLRAPGRIWPLVEVVDRRDDPPGSGLLSERTRQAIAITVNRGGTAFLFAHRRGYSAASRCGSCRTLRRCPSCGSRPDPQPTCRRCGASLGPCPECGGARFEPLGAGVGRLVEEVRRIVGAGAVGEHPAGTPVTVGTERDLTTLGHKNLVVLVDIDGLILGVDYRAAEEALRIGARLAGRVHHGSGNRLIVQTNDPDHPVVASLRRADPLAFARHELEVRRSLSYPPHGQLLVIEARGAEAGSVDAELRAIAAPAAILGPAESRSGVRWLVQGSDLATFKKALRPVLQRLRDSGATMRIDVDPIDL